MITVRHLSKSFGTVRAVNDLSLDVERGSIFAFLGTNGAGKSTTISCITTLRQADEGTIEVNGHRVGQNDDAIRRAIGVVFQPSLLDPTLSVRENLDTRAAFYGLSRADRSRRITELAGLVDLTGFLERRYGTLSGGQKRRADIARALIHSPVLLFLDEPTAGLDPQSREQVWSTINSLRENHGLTVFLTTHYMDETERADRVSIIDAGSIVTEGTPADLRKRFSSSVLTVVTEQTESIRAAAAGRGFVVREVNETLALNVPSSDAALEFIGENRSSIADFEFRHGTMDDVFLSATARIAPEEKQ